MAELDLRRFNLVRYDVLGFKNENTYINYFLDSLLKTNWTYDYFVQWKKVRTNLQNYVKEISLLNALAKIPPEKRKSELESIFIQYPETIPIIPLIIAMREKSIPILEAGEKTFYKLFDFSRRKTDEKEAENLVVFCEKVGILALFQEINDLYAYLMGVEVGLDSNARKNRSGEIFQQLLALLLRKKANKYGLELKAEYTGIQTTRVKRVDFLFFSKEKLRIAIECNFYNTTGSKPIEVANSYIDFQRKIRERSGYSFIWITDGQAWTKMQATVKQSFKEIDFPINYTIAQERIDCILDELTR